MFKSLTYIVIVVLLVLFSGCVKQIPDPITNNMSPLPDNWKQIVTKESKEIFKDPYSIVYDFGKETKIYKCSVISKYITDIIKKYKYSFLYKQPTDILVFNNRFSGYCGIVKINAKNSYGDYTGIKPFIFIIKDSKLVYISELDVFLNTFEYITDPPSKLSLCTK
jgi:hypothetical protein